METSAIQALVLDAPVRQLLEASTSSSLQLLLPNLPASPEYAWRVAPGGAKTHVHKHVHHVLLELLDHNMQDGLLHGRSIFAFRRMTWRPLDVAFHLVFCPVLPRSTPAASQPASRQWVASTCFLLGCVHGLGGWMKSGTHTRPRA
jgi:hypothetical protein